MSDSVPRRHARRRRRLTSPRRKDQTAAGSFSRLVSAAVGAGDPWEEGMRRRITLARVAATSVLGTWQACAALGAALLIAACSPAAHSGTPTASSLPTATATASSSPTPVVFTSTPYRYSITLPIGWIAEPATTIWNGVG